MSSDDDIKYLNALSELLDKHGDKIQLVGSFDLKPGSTIILKSDKYLSIEHIKALQDCFAKAFNHSVKALVLDPGLGVAAVARSQVETVDTKDVQG